MRWKILIVTLTGLATALPWAATAQQSNVPIVGFLHNASPRPFENLVAQFRHGLGEIGFVEGQNVKIEYRWAEGYNERLPALTAELLRLQVNVIAVPGNTPGALAAKTATSTIPIVFAVGADPIKQGFVASFNKPAGNMTGVTFLSAQIVAKRMQLLHGLVPMVTVIGLLINPANPVAEADTKEAEEAARSLGLKLDVVKASSESEIDGAFGVLKEHGVGMLLVGGDAFLGGSVTQIASLSLRHRIPSSFVRREFPAAGGLMSYGADFADIYRKVGAYVGRILKGEKPAELPVLQPTTFELVINLKTAKALGLDVPWHLQQIADEVIE